MQSYTPKQLQSTFEAGGIDNVTIAAQGARFYVRIRSHTGDGILTKARSDHPRPFSTPTRALTELRRLGVRVGGFDTTQWAPEQREAPIRPDRAQAMNEMYALAEHTRWVREHVIAAQAEAANPATEWADQATIDADSDAQRQRLKARLNNN